jgi:poly-beta-1,6-N-acetyl-D-glucosamine synthase
MSNEMRVNDDKHLRYVLITPARDEAAQIRQTLEAMAAQTQLPLKWVIVSDGSTDGTDEIVAEYTAKHSWIKLLRTPERKERHFGGKVFAFRAGYALVQDLEFEVIGNLDADSSFEPDYIEYLLDKFARYPRLGVAGTNYVEDEWDSALKHDYRFASIEDVTGQCQLFRRECYEAIGGYQPSKYGGVDLFATLSARMNGWQTRVFTDKVLIHHRQQGTATRNKFVVEYSNGRKDYLFGNHPLFEVCRIIYRLTKRPIILGSCLLLVGYAWAMLTGAERIASQSVLEFRKREQLARLKRIFRGLGASNLRTPSGAATESGMA